MSGEGLCDLLQHATKLLDNFAYLRLAHNERGRDSYRISTYPRHHTFLVEEPLHDFEAAHACPIGVRRELDRTDETDCADIEDVWRVLQHVERICPHILKPVCALKQALVAIKIQRCNRRGTSERMRRIGVAVKKFDRVDWGT
jgi:hypothetical protein